MKLAILIPPSKKQRKGGILTKTATHSLTQKHYGVEEEQALPAIQRYDGVLYKGLDYSSTRKEWIYKHVYILTREYGLIDAQHPIGVHKSDLKTSDANIWKSHNSEMLHECFVIDLLPDTHRKAVNYEYGIQINFYKQTNGKKTRIGHFAKHIKGRFVRWMAQNNITDPNEIYSFTEDGFEWTGEYFLKKK